MCCTWSRVCCSLHILYNLAYIGIGATQIILGILLFFSFPSQRLSSNVWTGCVNIVIGVGGAVFACVGDLTTGKQRAFLFLTVIVLGANLVNLIILEADNWRLFKTKDPAILAERENSKTFQFYVQISTISTLVAMLTSFLDSQFTFCSMQRKAGRKDSISHPDIITDIEYIIPRVKFDSGKEGKEKSDYLYDEYAQSWVFDADTVGSLPDHARGSGLCPTAYKSQNDFNLNKTYSVKLNRDFLNINNIKCSSSPIRAGPPVDIIVEGEPAKYSPLQCLTSFSPATNTPQCISRSSSQSSLSNAIVFDSGQPLYECLEKLSESSIYQSRLRSKSPSLESEDRSRLRSKSPSLESEDRSRFRSKSQSLESEDRSRLRSKSQSLESEDHPQSISSASVSLSVSHCTKNVAAYEQPVYASLLVELQKTISEKFPRLSEGASHQSTNQGSHQSSRQSSHQSRASTPSRGQETESREPPQPGAELEFSKELEAALQVIHSLESPNPSGHFESNSLTIDARADITSAAN
ncbi:uncharacterized protein [Bemisia tabaci]|uniref:uncharacterized protein n=1 Tax=Bemisia tabaci TaxID=7038 RepID=UPI003B2811C8